MELVQVHPGYVHGSWLKWPFRDLSSISPITLIFGENENICIFYARYCSSWWNYIKLLFLPTLLRLVWIGGVWRETGKQKKTRSTLLLTISSLLIQLQMLFPSSLFHRQPAPWANATPSPPPAPIRPTKWINPGKQKEGLLGQAAFTI